MDRFCSPKPRGVVAARPTGSARLRAIATDYVKHHRPQAERELVAFRTLSMDDAAISRAALGLYASGRRHRHQYRVRPNALSESRRRLVPIAPALASAGSFDELFDIVSSEIELIDGIGDLAVYDTALRIGGRFDLRPTKVYLHRGTREGAKALGLAFRRAYLELAELPAELQILSAREAEDALCIYKHELMKVTGFAGGGSRCSA
jgi:hypothetical protein